MFGLKRKKESASIHSEIVPADSVENMMGLKEVISVDSIKAHLVDMLEENRKLKAENERLRADARNTGQTVAKENEILKISADEWRKRCSEKDSEIRELKNTIDTQDRKIEEFENERNNLITKAEIATAELKKEREQQSDANKYMAALQMTFEPYMAGNFKNITKTQICDLLVEIFKADRSKSKSEVEENV